MAIGTPRDESRIPQIFYLAMIARLIRLVGDEHHLISPHHLFIGMAFLADLRMEGAAEFNGIGFFPRQDGDLMKSMTIRAVRRVPVSGKNRLSVDAFRIPIVLVAHRALFDYPDFVTTPGGELMDVRMAVRTPHIVDKMGTGVMFGSCDLMASMAGDPFGLDSPPLCRMFFDIGDIPVAAIAGIGSMDRLGESGYIDIFMTFQALGVVDTLQTVLPSPDLELLLGQLQFLMEFQFLSGTDYRKDGEKKDEWERRDKRDLGSLFHQ
jgi:hypothetical protein